MAEGSAAGGGRVSGYIVSRHWHRRWLYAYCPPYRWWKNSSLYHRWMMWRWKRAMRRMERVIANKLTPAIERATVAILAWQKAYGDSQ